MPTWAEMLPDRPAGRQEALRMSRRREAPHGAFALARRLVRIFCSVVEPPMATMFYARHDLRVGCRVAAKFVGDQDARHILAAFEQLAKELLGRRFVPSALHQDIEDGAILIDRPP